MKLAGLQYVDIGRTSGIRRIRRGRGFHFVRPNGSLIGARELRRIRSLAIPPAWKDVWICPSPRGHVQAVGVDARGRRQYLYHCEWTRRRNLRKFDEMVEFGGALAAIRKAVKRDLKLPGMSRNRVVACIVQLLDQTRLRIGNSEYARDNSSFGLTTIKNRHAQVKGGTIRFHFTGKSGKDHDVSINDPVLAGIVRRCRELPGQELFGYIDDRGRHVDVNSRDVNDYVLAATGRPFTAKDFRTWAGTVIAAEHLAQSAMECKRRRDTPMSDRQITLCTAGALRAAAEKLGNTMAVCRKSYVHPRLCESFVDGSLMKAFRSRTRGGGGARRMSRSELAVLSLMKSWRREQPGFDQDR